MPMVTMEIASIVGDAYDITIHVADVAVKKYDIVLESVISIL
jgi:hypothetical protein